MYDPREPELREPLFPFRRDKADPRTDFWHTIRWGLIFAAFVWVAVAAIHA